MQEQALELTAQDGYRLAATLTPAAGRERAVVVLAGATAVPRRYYARFARALAGHGLAVLTFDYRGVGGSRRGPLRGFHADFVVWAERDLAAALDWALARGPAAVVAHSFGGHAFGLLPRANETLGLYVFGSGSGWHGHMPPLEQAKVLFLWHALGPLATRALGYLPMGPLGMGEDLPLAVYHQWKRWCGWPRYFLEDPEVDFAARYARVAVPVVSVNARDDRWASPRAARALFGGLTAAPVRFVEVDPAAEGLAAVGHFGYFRPGASRLWAPAARFVLDRVGGHAAAAVSP